MCACIEKEILFFFNLIVLYQFRYIYHRLEFLVMLPFTQDYPANNIGCMAMMDCKRFSGKVNTTVVKHLTVFVIW